MPVAGAREHRMKCVFNEACSDSQYGNLSIQLDAAKRLYCHVCQTSSNILGLIHGLENHQPPAGGRLRGQEFKEAVAKLREINGVVDGLRPARTQRPTVTKQEEPMALPKEANVPMIRHENEAARNLADLHNDLVVDVAEMSPEAAQYVRKREWLTSELMQKWGVGWIPGNGRSLFRKNYLVYTHHNERGEVVSYSGRDLSFEAKWSKWLRDGKPEGKKPNKHRYVTGYKRGLELYGGYADRLNEPHVQESLNEYGVAVCEGQNEILRMESLGVAAVGLGSNKATDQQIEKLIRFAKQAGGNRALLLPDCDAEGEAGFKELLWRLTEAGVQTRLGFTSNTHDGMMRGRQPEDLTEEEWATIRQSLAK
ncbi:DNA primase [Rhodopirellula sallentina SM41]|uniref:DNA primase n=1 Tax=Rhodopirellula sallentina SM41 TaxID=1263870 RepID=M5UGY4_9BACT|nr:DNA primase [Rhodopirellula sallentina SM41]